MPRNKSKPWRPLSILPNGELRPMEKSRGHVQISGEILEYDQITNGCYGDDVKKFRYWRGNARSICIYKGEQRKHRKTSKPRISRRNHCHRIRDPHLEWLAGRREQWIKKFLKYCTERTYGELRNNPRISREVILQLIMGGKLIRALKSELGWSDTYLRAKAERCIFSTVGRVRSKKQT